MSLNRSFAKGLVTGLYDLKQHAMDKQSGFAPVPGSTLLLNRLQVGFFSVLARLDATFVQCAALSAAITKSTAFLERALWPSERRATS